ncbi:MAG: hypothetical protein ACXVB0_19000, partial [Mucilaginibacter sp.]
MTTNTAEQTILWPLWKKIIFRFFFVYLFFQLSPWTWLDNIPGVPYITRYYYLLMDAAVNKSNALIFHVRNTLVPLNGSGDTSYGWAQVWLMLSLAVTGCIIWSAFDRKRKNYLKLNYWLCLFARYYLALFAFLYGILKLFALQMYFPSLHQLATPLGDLLPMRFSWLFIGYSTPYQVFSGAAEVLAGLLLLNRRTATLGVLVATGVFTNVMLLNMSYDIPVKIFSSQLVLVCLFLLANEAERLWYFFVLNKPAPISNIYEFKYSKKWMRITRIMLKIVFIIIAIGMQIKGDIDYYKDMHKPVAKQPVKNGVYEVTTFEVNKKSIPLSLSDSMRWQDVIFENGYGSVKSADTSFRQRYRRGYFAYSADKKAPHILQFKKQPD